MKPYTQRGKQFGFEKEWFGESGLKMFLIIASRTARGETTTIRRLAAETGTHFNNVFLMLRKLRRKGLIEFEERCHASIRANGRYSLEFVEEPQCLKRFKDELRPQCRPTTVGSRTKRANAAA